MPSGRLDGSKGCRVTVSHCGLGINDFLCSLWWKSRLGQQKGVCMHVCASVCLLTQEIVVAWAARDLFHTTLLGTAGCPALEAGN